MTHRAWSGASELRQASTDPIGRTPRRMLAAQEVAEIEQRIANSLHAFGCPGENHSSYTLNSCLLQSDCTVAARHKPNLSASVKTP
jgi:hypothetical protein